MIRVGILGFSRREGTFSEVGLRSWEEAGCAAVEAVLMRGNEHIYVVHRPLVLRIARPNIDRILRDWCDSPTIAARCHLILTVGATAYTESDIVPEMTKKLLKRETPAIPDLLRRAASDAGCFSDGISRGLAGIRGGTLIINMPGSIQGHADPDSLTACTRALLPVLPDLLTAFRRFD